MYQSKSYTLPYSMEPASVAYLIIIENNFVQKLPFDDFPCCKKRWKNIQNPNPIDISWFERLFSSVPNGVWPRAGLLHAKKSYGSESL